MLYSLDFIDLNVVVFCKLQAPNDDEIYTELFVSDDLDQNLVGDGFTLSRLLGGDSGSPSSGPGAVSWDTLSESLASSNG